MGNVYIFRGIAGTGKTTLSNMLAKKLQIPVIRKDDIWDALPDTSNERVNNPICYNILCKIIQTNLDLQTNFIIDVALGHKSDIQSGWKIQLQTKISHHLSMCKSITKTLMPAPLKTNM